MNYVYIVIEDGWNHAAEPYSRPIAVFSSKSKAQKYINGLMADIDETIIDGYSIKAFEVDNPKATQFFWF